MLAPIPALLVHYQAIVLPHLKNLEVLVFSVGQLLELAELEGVASPAHVEFQDARWRQFMAVMRERWGLKRLVVCFKTRDQTGLQRRWSGTRQSYDL